MPNRLDVPPCFSASLRLATDRPIPIARCCDILPVAQRCMAGQFCLWSHRGALLTDLLTRSSPTRTLLVLNQKIDDCDNVSWVPYETSRTMPTALRCRRPLRSSACPQGASLVHPPVCKALLSFIRLSARRYFPTALRCRRPIRSSPDRPRCRRPFQVAVIRQQFSSLDLLLFGVRCTILPLFLFQLVRSSRLSGGLLKRRNGTARSLLSYTVFYYMGGPNPDEPIRIRPCE